VAQQQGLSGSAEEAVTEAAAAKSKLGLREKVEHGPARGALEQRDLRLCFYTTNHESAMAFAVGTRERVAAALKGWRWEFRDSLAQKLQGFAPLGAAAAPNLELVQFQVEEMQR
jgi:hypothetical protein